MKIKIFFISVIEIEDEKVKIVRKSIIPFITCGTGALSEIFLWIFVSAN